MNVRKAKRRGSSHLPAPWRDVPNYEPEPGFSINEVATANGWRVLGRRERTREAAGKVVATISDGSLGSLMPEFWCVEVTK
jgi:hypothetical protein